MSPLVLPHEQQPQHFSSSKPIESAPGHTPRRRGITRTVVCRCFVYPPVHGQAFWPGGVVYTREKGLLSTPPGIVQIARSEGQVEATPQHLCSRRHHSSECTRADSGCLNMVYISVTQAPCATAFCFALAEKPTPSFRWLFRLSWLTSGSRRKWSIFLTATRRTTTTFLMGSAQGTKVFQIATRQSGKRTDCQTM